MTKTPASFSRVDGANLLGVTVNGAPVNVGATRLDLALVELGFGAVMVATAVNGAFVPAGARTATTLASGDKIEIVAPRAGG